MDLCVKCLNSWLEEGDDIKSFGGGISAGSLLGFKATVSGLDREWEYWVGEYREKLESQESAVVGADIPLVLKWMSYLAEGQWCFAKINHACFSHSTRAQKKSLASSPVSEREKVGSCQFDTVSRIFPLWRRVKWVTNTDPVSVLWQPVDAADTCREVTCRLQETQLSKSWLHVFWQLQQDHWMKNDRKHWRTLLLWHLHEEEFSPEIKLPHVIPHKRVYSKNTQECGVKIKWQ